MVRGMQHSARVGLHSWFSCLPGREVVRPELAYIHRALADLFGYHLVQVGRLGNFDLMEQSRILHRLVIDIDGAVAPSPYPEVCGAACSLPVESDSVDVVLLPHVLEFEPDPHAALREAFRILVPEGYLLISVFNPWSLMGMWRLWGARSGSPPWQGQFLGAIRIKDWLALLGFDVLSSEPCFFRPPLRRERLLQRLACMEAFGKRAFPYLAGANVLVAKKRIATLTPIRPAWKLRRKLVGVGLAGPTAGRVEVPGNARMPAFADQPTNGDHDGPCPTSPGVQSNRQAELVPNFPRPCLRPVPTSR